MRLRLLAACFVVAGGCGGRSGLAPGELELAASGSGGVAGAMMSAGAAGGRPSAGSGGASAAGSATGGAAAAGSDPGGSGGAAGENQAGDGGEGGVPCEGDGSVEVCNGVDDDCDGVIDDGLPLVAQPGPITVRDDQGRTDVGLGIDCDSCGWAWDPQLVETDDGLGVLWFLGIWGGQEQPSVFHRRYDRNLEPLGDVSVLGGAYWMGGLRRGTPTRDGALMVLVERVGNDDVGSFAFVDRRLSVPVTVPLEGCSQPSFIHGLSPLAPRVVSCVSEHAIHLFQLDGSRRSVVARHERPLGEASAGPRSAGSAFGALRGQRGLVAMAVRPEGPSSSTILWTLEISATGEPLAAYRHQRLEELDNLLVEGLFATDEGYLLFGHDYTAGASPRRRFVIPLGPDGALAGAPIDYTNPKQSYWDDIAFIPDGPGLIAVTSQEHSGLTVKQLDSTGKVWHEVATVTAAYSPPTLLFSRGHLYVAFAEPPSDSDENRVLLQRFSCTL